MATKAHEPITPGEILSEEFLKPLGISQYRIAKAIGVPPTRIGEIIHGKRRITPDTALKLSKALGLSERYWINVQADYDIEVAKETGRAELDRIVPLTASRRPRPTTTRPIRRRPVGASEPLPNAPLARPRRGA